MIFIIRSVNQPEGAWDGRSVVTNPSAHVPVDTHVVDLDNSHTVCATNCCMKRYLGSVSLPLVLRFVVAIFFPLDESGYMRMFIFSFGSFLQKLLMRGASYFYFFYIDPIESCFRIAQRNCCLYSAFPIRATRRSLIIILCNS